MCQGLHTSNISVTKTSIKLRRFLLKYVIKIILNVGIDVIHNGKDELHAQ